MFPTFFCVLVNVHNDHKSKNRNSSVNEPVLYLSNLFNMRITSQDKIKTI